jgi:hypothetical protein
MLKINDITKANLEDAIFFVKYFINELTNVQEDYFDKLAKRMNLTEEGTNWLFDYIHNSGEAGNHLSFEEYLSEHNLEFQKFINENHTQG